MNLIGKYIYSRILKNMQNRYNSQQQPDNRHKEGDVYIKNKPQNKKHIPDNEGEYVDFEEMK